MNILNRSSLDLKRRYADGFCFAVSGSFSSDSSMLFCALSLTCELFQKFMEPTLEDLHTLDYRYIEHMSRNVEIVTCQATQKTSSDSDTQ
jgi:hypothetical protein